MVIKQFLHFLHLIVKTMRYQNHYYSEVFLCHRRRSMPQRRQNRPQKMVGYILMLLSFHAKRIHRLHASGRIVERLKIWQIVVNKSNHFENGFMENMYFSSKVVLSIRQLTDSQRRSFHFDQRFQDFCSVWK